MNSKNLVGGVLASLVLFSAFLAVGGIWGVIEGDKAAQLIGTFFIVGLATMGLSYVANTFFK